MNCDAEPRFWKGLQVRHFQAEHVFRPIQVVHRRP
jgi:hypothetical protein